MDVGTDGRVLIFFFFNRVMLYCIYCCCSRPKCVRFFATPWTAAHQASLSFTNSRSLLKFISIQLVMTPSHLILCRLLLLSLSQRQGLSDESTLCVRWPKYWSFSISPSNEYSGLISFRIDWFELFAVQRDSQESSLTPQFKSINS